MFKIALNAGHGLYTSGKRCLKSIDPNETREWVLNSRICNKIEDKLKAYSGYELIRLDDTTGETDIALKTRTNKANNFKADFYLSIHHNAGVNGGSGGGLIAIVYKTCADGSITCQWQKALYDRIIAKTGLKGNRSVPLQKQDLHEVRESNMSCVLLECGFMDSATDTPIILTDDFAEKVASACVEVLVEKGGLTKKESQPYGYLDFADCHSISGWAYNGTDKEMEVHIYGYKDGQQVFGISNVIANLYREDLKANGIGNGKHSFCYEYDLAQYGDGTYTIKAFAIGGSNPQLTNDLIVVCNENYEREKAEQDKKEQIADTIEKNVEEITEEEKQNVLSIFAEFLVKLIRFIFNKGDK